MNENFSEEEIVEDEDVLQGGTEAFVDLFDGGDAQCSLSATIINNEILYIVENDGNIDEYEIFPQALEEYIRTCFEKKNGAKTAIL